MHSAYIQQLWYDTQAPYVYVHMYIGIFVCIHISLNVCTYMHI